MLESEVASLVASECDCAQAAVEVNRLKLALLPSRHDGEILLRYSPWNIDFCPRVHTVESLLEKG